MKARFTTPLVAMKQPHLRFAAALAVSLLFTAGLPAIAATHSVTNLADRGEGSLRDAISAAISGDTIIFRVHGTITLTSGELTLGRNLIIAGPGTGNLTISGDAVSRVFNILPNTVGSISNLTIRNGRIVGADGRNLYYHCDDRGEPVINLATAGGSGAGGGVYNAGDLTVASSFEYSLGINASGALVMTVPQPPPATPLTVIGGVVTSNVWHHVAGVYIPGQSVTVFVDGSATQQPASFAQPVNTTAPFYIGRGGAGSFLNGRVDELCLYQRALGENEIRAITASGAAGKCWRPVLSIVRDPQGVRLVWPLADRGYRLQQTTLVPGGTWSSEATPPNYTSSPLQVLVPAAPGSRFFRLIAP